jgi:hypothetical protein
MLRHTGEKYIIDHTLNRDRRYAGRQKNLTEIGRSRRVDSCRAGEGQTGEVSLIREDVEDLRPLH